MNISKEIFGWALFIICAVVLFPAVILAAGCAPRSIRRGWDREANRMSGMED